MVIRENDFKVELTEKYKFILFIHLLGSIILICIYSIRKIRLKNISLKLVIKIIFD